MATKKDYELVARVIKRQVDSPLLQPQTYAVIELIASDLCDGFEADNNAFDTEKFLRACGVAAEEG